MRRPTTPQPKAYVTPLLVASVALALGAVAFLAARELSGGSPQAVADLGPNPPEVPSMSAPWPDFSNKVLHWQNYSYSFDLGSPDHSNGQEIRGEIWVQVGPNNRPVALRGTFLHEDGLFHQEYLYVNGQETLVFDQPVLPPDAPVQLPTPCRQEFTLDAATFARVVDTGEPLYVDRAKIASLGLERANAPSMAIPSLEPAGLGVAPEYVIGAGTSVAEVWVKEKPTEGGNVKVDVLELDPDSGRLQAEAHFERLPDGSQVTQSRRTQTAVEVFEERDVPPTVFDARSLAEGCGA